ncbi:hypothetical protein [Halotia branconii]|uniref:Solute-binding protein family 3/N-terminal domain-containing protein n=1 Tax=Halotia branconii CENA392 TaxID=1539056 RepID=A0AAJ6NTN8_9CYAN|nr:hypothetical protein [Halotia branconii]WGV26530.1 hypothetical protein QI031_03190 [Halotia branconii CENA392]
MRFLLVLLTLFGIGCSTSTAEASSVIERVKARHLVRCGSVERPGLATETQPGVWSGLNVDVCRAIAAAVLGSPDRIEYHKYETDKDFDAVRNQEDDVYFLTRSEINTQKLTNKLVLGPTVFLESDTVMVASTSAVHHLTDLADDSICFMIGSSVEQSLNAYFGKLHKNWFRRAFSEDGEMIDTYNVQNCHAIAGEITTLANIRLDPGVNRLSSRILPESVNIFAVIAATKTDDTQWSAIVAWIVHTLINLEIPKTQSNAESTGKMPVSLSELFIDKEWQRHVLTSVGSYSDIFNRNLGKGSPLRLDRGLNTNHSGT